MGQPGHKVILIVGGTGSGKSTFINSLANYLYEVNFEHPFRFQLITERDNATEAKTSDSWKSQTKKITAYELNDTRLPYCLTLVDTPGFGDTEGLERDKLTFDYIKRWFEQRDENGLHTIDAVCTVVKGTEARFNAQVKHELRSVQSLFGLDMKGNMMYVLTFCDNKDPPALNVLRGEGLLVGDKTFLLNNRGVMEVNESDKDLLRMFWKRCHASFEQFFERLQETKPQSIVLTLDVLYHRKALEKQTAILGDQVSNQVAQLQQITSIIKQVQQSQKAQIKIKRKRWVKTKTPHSNSALNVWCKDCNFTCHEKCTEVSEHETSLINCDVMTVKDPTSAQCTACPNNCSWKAHFPVDFVVKYEEIDEEISIENLYAEYGIKNEDKERFTKLLRQLALALIEQDKTVAKTLKSIRQRLNQLNRIAMRPSQATDSQYIQFLIELEKARMRPGDDDQRLQVLQSHLKIAQLVESSETDAACYVDETESAAIAYLCSIFPDLYKELRRNGYFGLAEQEGISPAAVLDQIEQKIPGEYAAAKKATKANGSAQQQAKVLLDNLEVSHPTVVAAAKQELGHKQVTTRENQEISDAKLDAEIQDMRSAMDAAVQTSDSKPKKPNPSLWMRFKRLIFS
uniref:G domain-containing protein n=1 Tax=Plectus sambesii TaxID=2011161 RepID=A0A914WYC3_9BILA